MEKGIILVVWLAEYPGRLDWAGKGGPVPKGCMIHWPEQEKTEIERGDDNWNCLLELRPG